MILDSAVIYSNVEPRDDVIMEDFYMMRTPFQSIQC